MATAKWTSQARRELAEIAYHIGIEACRPATADSIVDEINLKCEEYASRPLMGNPADDLDIGLRTCRYKRWVIIYRPTDYGLDVISVVDGSRDYPRQFPPHEAS